MKSAKDEEISSPKEIPAVSKTTELILDSIENGISGFVDDYPQVDNNGLIYFFWRFACAFALRGK